MYNTKIKQDNQNKNEIFELYYQRIQANSKLKELKKYLTDLNKEIGLWQKREYQKQIELNVTKEKQKTFGNVENVLFTVSIATINIILTGLSVMYDLTTYPNLCCTDINNQLSR